MQIKWVRIHPGGPCESEGWQKHVHGEAMQARTLKKRKEGRKERRKKGKKEGRVKERRNERRKERRKEG